MRKTIFKGHVLFLIAILLYSVSPIHADNEDLITTTISLNVEKAGTLKNMISAYDKYRITSLVLKGELNVDDIKFIRDMAGCYDSRGHFSDGNLLYLNMTDVKFASVSSNDIDDIDRFTVYDKNGGKRTACVFSGTMSPGIGGSMFSYLERLKEISLPKYITYVYSSAFKSCENLTRVYFPERLKLIGAEAFKDCKKLSTMNTPEFVDEIGVRAFAGCEGLTQVFFRTLKVSDEAFKNCTNLKKVEILPDDEPVSIGGGLLADIHNGAFMDCTSLSWVKIQAHTIGDEAFVNCKSLKKDVYFGDELWSIGKHAFYDCNLQSIELNSVPEIENSFPPTTTLNLFLRGGVINPNARIKFASAKYYAGYGFINNWSTQVLPFDLNITGEESQKFYALNKITTEEIVLQQITDKISAGTPFFVKHSPDENEIIYKAHDVIATAAINDYTVDGITFRGTYKTLDFYKGVYFLAKDKIWSIDELQNKQSGHVFVSAYHAWFEGTLPNKVNKLSTVDGSNTTDISSIIDSLNSPNVRYYDLNGHCLSDPQKGINIMRMADRTSKKILIK